MKAFHLQILLVVKNSAQWAGAPELLVTLRVIRLVPGLLWASVSTSVQWGADVGSRLVLPQRRYRWFHMGQHQKGHVEEAASLVLFRSRERAAMTRSEPLDTPSCGLDSWEHFWEMALLPSPQGEIWQKRAGHTPPAPLRGANTSVGALTSLSPSLKPRLVTSPRSLALSPGCCHCLGADSCHCLGADSSHQPAPEAARPTWLGSSAPDQAPTLQHGERSPHPCGCRELRGSASRFCESVCLCSSRSQSSQAGSVGADRQTLHSQLVVG